MTTRKFSIFFLMLIGLFSVGLTLSCTQNSETPEAQPKYVFYFIGDGMGLAHVSLAEAFLAAQDGKISNASLNFSTFPVIGLATTFSDSNYITDSSAAGTALSSGEKTTNGMLGVRTDGSPLKSITYSIHDAGYKVGITSSVTIDHATPAAFYASSSARSSYYDIAQQLTQTNFEFFGGGGFLQPTGKDNDQANIYEAVKAAGYTVARGLNSYNAAKQGATKMFYTQAEGIESDLPYAIDRKEGDLSLAKIVEAAIDFLDNPKGFFLMSEGGKIDWAAHSNDGKATILETLDFAEAIAVALEFYKKHPNETLIVVTADHETGGLALAETGGYNMHFDKLAPQTHSIDLIKATHPSPQAEIEAIRKMNKDAKIGWTSSSHSGIAVPVYAIGAGSARFGGKMDNTDIPKRICELMGVTFTQQ
jgi:Alkaline phosphatase